MSEWIDREKAIEDLQNGDPSQLYDMEDIKYWLNCLPLAHPEGRSGVFIPDITVKNLRKAPLEAVGELLVVGEMEDIVLPSAQAERKTGTWELMFNGQFKGGAYWFSCSKCNRIVPEVRNGGWNYCPNCGADMRGDSDE